ncbi:unnamed protein product [Rhizoctonia solani]|uniref:Uncharacterized protein n=1 Tax=Rhizoctonia solani TaxID=456999 RepID=A0A8H3ALF9_9AGAM|nr:unnamed protein product [Rhizoctonia solani]
MTIPSYSLNLDHVAVNIHVHPALSEASRIAVLFVLHGHPASAHHMKPIVNGTFELAKNKAMLLKAKRNLVIITFDMEDDYSEVAEEPEHESTQVYRKQERIASTVSRLMDTLPAVLCPNNDRFIDTWMVAGLSLGAHAACDTWMVAGLSLGAHAAWLAMDRDPRLSVCIPIIGSPDFLDIATARNNLTGFPLVSSYMTPTTRNYILKHDPVSHSRSSLRPNPFMNKHILALAGAQDSLIPFLATRQFLDRINVGPLGTKQLIIQQGVGHQCTREMVVEMVEVIWDRVLQ